MYYRAIQIWVLSALFLTITACSDNYKAPVKSLSTTKQQKAPVAYNAYRVQRGDTLYSIAFRYGLNYQNLARNNSIATPYRIKPGQLLVLNDDYVPYQEVIVPKDEKSIVDATPKQPVTKKPTSTEQRKPTVIAQKKPTQATTKTPVKKPKVNTRFDTQRSVNKWYWPIKSSRKYQRTAENQFVFKVPAGTPVHAVAAGRVVYSGIGLVGYGHLVIIKHSNSLLSAYAFNDQVLVKEKQDIRAGQKISTVGKSPTGVIGLGFEIRLRGKPVDARKYLPR